MKIILEREKCIGCGSCAVLCPKYFEMKDDGKSSIIKGQKNPQNNTEELEVKQAECSQEGVDSCPVQCIHIVK